MGLNLAIYFLPLSIRMPTTFVIRPMSEHRLNGVPHQPPVVCRFGDGMINELAE